MNTIKHVIYPDLAERVILVTGSRRGLGKSIAEFLATQKCHLLIQWRADLSEAENFKNKLLEMGAHQVDFLFFDLQDTEKMVQELDRIEKEVTPLIHGVVNNAGISKDQLYLRVKPDDIAEVMSINLNSPMILTQKLSRRLMKSPQASVVTISSIVGLMGNTGQAVYSASKAGLIGWTKSLAQEFGSKNLRFNAIAPGFIETEMTHELSEEVKKQYLSGIPLQRFGQTEEVAQLVAFLLSNSSSYITGEVIKIDGGLYT